jgi:hypothetical protein
MTANYGRLEFNVQPLPMKHLGIEDRSTVNFNAGQVTLRTPADD